MRMKRVQRNKSILQLCDKGSLHSVLERLVSRGGRKVENNVFLGDCCDLLEEKSYHVLVYECKVCTLCYVKNSTDLERNTAGGPILPKHLIMFHQLFKEYPRTRDFNRTFGIVIQQNIWEWQSDTFNIQHLTTTDLFNQHSFPPEIYVTHLIQNIDSELLHMHHIFRPEFISLIMDMATIEQEKSLRERLLRLRAQGLIWSRNEVPRKHRPKLTLLVEQWRTLDPPA